MRKWSALSRNSLTSSFFFAWTEIVCDENIVVRAHEQRRRYLMVYKAAFILSYLILAGRVAALLLGPK